MMNDKVSIPKNLARRLERVTRKAGVTPSVLVRTALSGKESETAYLKALGATEALLRSVLALTKQQPSVN